MQIKTVLRRAQLLSSALVLLTAAASTTAQQPLRTLLVGADQRPAQSLDGDWHYLVEQPPARELYDGKGNIRDNGYALNTHPNISSGPHNSEYDFSTAPTLKVPGDWNTQDPTLLRFEGVVWYQRDFNVTPPTGNQPGTRTFFHVGAANYRSVLWINGKRLCDHEGGFTPFDCDATSLLHPGSNFVVIAVDSTRHQDDIPSVSYDFYDYGGLTRDVSLITVPAQFIDDYKVQLAHGPTFAANTAAARTVDGYVHVEGASAGTSVSISIPEAGVSITATTDANGRAPFHAEAKHLDLWSTTSPRLYKVELRAGTDTVTDQIGFRDVRVDGTRILLNGKPVALLGANMHAEAPIRGGRAITDADMQNILKMLHDIHANYVRLCHYPHDERMTRATDRAGILVWSEIPLWQRISFEKPEVYSKAVTMLHEMIRRDQNKASVIFWSVSNETPNNPDRTHFLTDLANEARHTDSTRLITSALIGPHSSGDRIVQEDPLMAALDVVGQNEYIGWYEGTPEDADRKTWVLPNKPFIMSEFGAEAKYGNHGSPNDRWTEEQQANVLQHQFDMIRRIPQMRGVTPWVLMDFRSSTRNIPKLQDGYNRKGLFSETMQPKQSVELVRKTYTTNPPVKPE
ncbi:glycoside hydrolase family 2 protein [Terriglobus sp.]|uniref:glycoside hydrolase family 2 protein n=1 Tax=Terriglobus sp. TaxID=1889013 RepID=UPI003B005780